MVIPKYLNFCSIIFNQNFEIYPKHNDKEYGVLEMVKNKFLEVKTQHFAIITQHCASG